MAGLEKIVTDELVAEIADRLTAAGRKVTMRALHEEIGGGSMTTIHTALRRWHKRQEIKAEAPVARVPLPEGIIEAMRDAVEQLWKAAQHETQKEIEQMTQEVKAQVAEAVEARDGVLAELESTADELKALQAKAAGVDSELQAACQKEERVLADLATAVRRAGQLEARLEEVERRANGLEAELVRVHAAARAEREDQAAAAAAAAAVIQDDLDVARRKLAEVQGDLDHLMKNAQTEQQHHDTADKRAREDAKKAADLLIKAEAARDQALADATDAREEAARLRGEVEALRGGQADLLKVLAGLAERLPEAKVPA